MNIKSVCEIVIAVVIPLIFTGFGVMLGMVLFT